jgi:quinol-cytochrome oxidoreductase complex cytochrome b subunit
MSAFLKLRLLSTLPMRGLLRHIDKRLGLAPLLDALRHTQPIDYLSPLEAPPFSPGRLALMLLALLIMSGLGLTLYYNPTAEGAALSLTKSCTHCGPG